METNKNILDHLKARKQTPVDASYFESFQQDILKQINVESTQPAKKNQAEKGKVFYLRPIFWMSSAAAVIVFIIVSRIFISEKEIHFAHLSEDEIKSYLKENPIDDSHTALASLDDIKIPDPGDTTKAKMGITSTSEEKNKPATEVPGFKSSAQILEELSNEELYEFIESEEFELEEEEITLLN